VKDGQQTARNRDGQLLSVVPSGRFLFHVNKDPLCEAAYIWDVPISASILRAVHLSTLNRFASLRSTTVPLRQIFADYPLVSMCTPFQHALTSMVRLSGITDFLSIPFF
jgi:hypothetical protein